MKYRVLKEKRNWNKKSGVLIKDEQFYYPQYFDEDENEWCYFENKKPTRLELDFPDDFSAYGNGYYIYFIKFKYEHEAIDFCLNLKKENNKKDNVVWES